MPLFARPTGVPSENAELATHQLQGWLDTLNPEEYTLLEEELRAEPTTSDRPMVTRTNAEIDRLKTLYASPEGEEAWSLVVKSRL
ncbi:hypothetical protein GCM10023213_48540 [Prosthecobacter algae]|uniref:Addiction module component n=1 Tax=Prosthecobacter algae TaxID=1144682 RepID=A0ABP9PTP2_9BACT